MIEMVLSLKTNKHQHVLQMFHIRVLSVDNIIGKTKKVEKCNKDLWNDTRPLL